MTVIIESFAVAVGFPHKTPHSHSNSQIVSLDSSSGNMTAVWIAKDGVLNASDYLAVVHSWTKYLSNSLSIRPDPIDRYLYPFGIDPAG